MQPAEALQVMLRRMPDAAALIDRTGRILRANEALESLLGFPQGGLDGARVSRFVQGVGPEEPRWRELLDGAHEQLELECRLVRQGCQLTPARLRAWRLPDAQGAATSVLLLVDLPTARPTEERAAMQRDAEQALRESEARYRSIFENSLDAIMFTAPTGEIFTANPAACRILDRTEEEICRLGRSGILDPTDPRLPTFLEERRRTGRARAELTALRKDGTKIPVEVSSGVFRDASGAERTSLSFHDLTERKRAESALRLLSEAGEVLAGSLDPQATLQSLTRLAVPRVADLCMVELLEGESIRRVAVSHRAPAKEPSLKALRTGISSLAAESGVEKVMRTAQPELVPVVTEEWLRAATRNEERLRAARALGMTSMLVVPLVGRGRAIGVLSLALIGGSRRYDDADLRFAQSFADRAALALDNARLYTEALETRRLRDEMLGIVSHDLRNPLNSISLNAQRLAMRSDAPEPASILRAVARAEQLIGDLLTTAMIEAGKLPLERQDEPVRSIVEEVVDLDRALAEGKSIALSATTEDGLPTVHVDRHRIVQLLSNLVGNAIKFTSEGGCVTLSARQIGGELQFVVSDNGPGIPAEHMAHLFDRFWQGTRARRAGAGLGLAIVKGIAEAHGGEVRVVSEVGKGSIFTFSMPLTVEVAQASSP